MYKKHFALYWYSLIFIDHQKSSCMELTKRLPALGKCQPTGAVNQLAPAMWCPPKIGSS